MPQSLHIEQLKQLREPFYRVAVKALIFDADRRLAVVINKNGLAELPGGGWERGESIPDCIRREVREETCGVVTKVGSIVLVARGKSGHGWPVLRLVLSAEVEDSAILQPGNGMQAVRFLTKEEFVRQEFALTDRAIQPYADTIWNESRDQNGKKA